MIERYYKLSYTFKASHFHCIGADDRFLTERDRQALLVRLMREKRQAEKEGNFEEAALLMGLLERQQNDAKNRSGF